MASWILPVAALSAAGQASEPSDQILSASGQTTDAPLGASGTTHRVLLFNHGLEFPVAFERVFDFATLPFSGQFRDETRNGIRVRANGQRHWVHLDGSPMGGRVARQPDAREVWTIDLPADSHVFEFRMWESTQSGVGPATCFHFEPCVETLYRIRVFSGTTLLEDIDYSPDNDQLNVVGLWSSTPITQIRMEAETNNIDDEFLGTLRIGTTPLPGSLEFTPSQLNSQFGQHATVDQGRALVSDSEGFEFWRRDPLGGWQYVGRRDSDGTVERMALSSDHAAVAVETGAGRRLRIYAVDGDDPGMWPVTELPFSSQAYQIHIQPGLVALGIDGQIRLYRPLAPDGWVYDSVIAPGTPIVGASEFGRNFGIDGPVMVVNGGKGLFYVYQRFAGTQFNEIFRQESQFTSRSALDVSGTTVAVQTFEGGLRIFEPNQSNVWIESSLPFSQLPGEIGLARGEGVRISGDTMIALRSFQISPSLNFRRIVEIWRRDGQGEFVRTALFQEPHKKPSGESQLGSLGRAFELSGDDMVLGFPGTSWCDHTFGDRSFFGETTNQGYANVCEGKSGAVFFAQASKLDPLIFASGFEP